MVMVGGLGGWGDFFGVLGELLAFKKLICIKIMCNMEFLTNFVGRNRFCGFAFRNMGHVSWSVLIN
jgi:hypothetical protein